MEPRDRSADDDACGENSGARWREGAPMQQRLLLYSGSFVDEKNEGEFVDESIACMRRFNDIRYRNGSDAWL